MGPVPLAPATAPFDFKDPKEISAVSLSLDSPLEPIVGYAKGISGSLFFDPDHPGRARGGVSISASSVRFANDGYTATAQGYALNAKRWPLLTLTLRRVESVRRVSPTRFEGVVSADFTCRGITQPKRLAVTADYLPGRAEERTNGRFKGDLLVLRTHFSVSRKAHGISEGIPDAMVGDAVEVGVAVVGIRYAAPKPDTLWETELARRDDPQLLRIARLGRRLEITTAGATAGGLIERDGTFRLDANSALGEATGRLGEDGSGSIHLRDGDVPLYGHRVAAFSTRPNVATCGTGLAELRLSERMARAGTPGLAVVRLAGDRVAGTGLYGVRRAGSPVPIADSTLFEAGTMGVPVLHLTALRLAAAGRIDLGRRVDDILGKGAVPDGPQGWGSLVTVRDLLRGTSGFGFSKSGGLRPESPVDAPIEIPAPERKPGTGEAVSSTNEALLERVVAQSAARSADEVVRDEIFRPLGMRDSTYAPHPPGAASGHYSGGEPTLDPFHRYPDALGNGLWTSARDFSRLLVEVGKLIGGRPNLLLAERSRGLLGEVDARESLLGIRKASDGSMFLGGDPYGFYCEFFLRPDRGDGLLVLQNRMMAWRLTNEIVAADRKAPAVLAKPRPSAVALPRIGGGAPLSLDAVRGSRSLVVFFLNEQCGVTVFYRDRLRRLERDYASRGFAFVAVRTGRKSTSDGAVELPERAVLRMPFLDDEKGLLMRAYGVGQSMTFAVLDRAGRLRYFGGFDDNVDPAKVRHVPLRDALEAVAAGRPVRIPRAPAIGCAILPVER